MNIEKLRNKKDRTPREETELKLREKVIAEFGGSPNPLKRGGAIELPENLEEAREGEVERFEELKNKQNKTPGEDAELEVLEDFLKLTDPKGPHARLPSEQELEEGRKKIEDLIRRKK